MLSSPYWMRRRAQKIVYAHRQTRAYFVSHLAQWDFGAQHPAGASDRPDARAEPGRLRFACLYPSYHCAAQSRSDGGTYNVTVGFDNIADVRDVDALIEWTYHPHNKADLTPSKTINGRSLAIQLAQLTQVGVDYSDLSALWQSVTSIAYGIFGAYLQPQHTQYNISARTKFSPSRNYKKVYFLIRTERTAIPDGQVDWCCLNVWQKKYFPKETHSHDQHSRSLR